jgi:DNA-directed RNA polymerase specialized sigma24 family protein
LTALQAEEILMEAADKVLKPSAKESKYENLPAYLFTSYKRLILKRLRRSRNELELDANNQEQMSAPSAVVAQDIELRILVEEIARRMDQQNEIYF